MGFGVGFGVAVGVGVGVGCGVGAGVAVGARVGVDVATTTVGVGTRAPPLAPHAPNVISNTTPSSSDVTRRSVIVFPAFLSTSWRSQHPFIIK